MADAEPDWVSVGEGVLRSGYSRTLLHRLVKQGKVLSRRLENPVRKGRGSPPSIQVDLRGILHYREQSKTGPRRNTTQSWVEMSAVRALLLGPDTLEFKGAWIRTHLSSIMKKEDLAELYLELHKSEGE